MDYLKILADLRNYYKNLLIVQYNQLPKAAATIALMADFLLANMIFLQIRDSFDWRTATGKQLDIIGKWVGCTRFYNGQLFDFRPWFSLVPYDVEPDILYGGFSRYSNWGTLDGGFMDYNNIKPTWNKLGDDSFRMMIGLKIIKNNMPMTAKNIDTAIWDFEYFNHQVYTVWGENTLTYYFPRILREVIEVAANKKVLPVPTGVKLILEEITT